MSQCHPHLGNQVRSFSKTSLASAHSRASFLGSYLGKAVVEMGLEVVKPDLGLDTVPQVIQSGGQQPRPTASSERDWLCQPDPSFKAAAKLLNCHCVLISCFLSFQLTLPFEQGVGSVYIQSLVFRLMTTWDPTLASAHAHPMARWSSSYSPETHLSSLLQYPWTDAEFLKALLYLEAPAQYGGW